MMSRRLVLLVGAAVITGASCAGIGVTSARFTDRATFPFVSVTAGTTTTQQRVPVVATPRRSAETPPPQEKPLPSPIEKTPSPVQTTPPTVPKETSTP